MVFPPRTSAGQERVATCKVKDPTALRVSAKVSLVGTLGGNDAGSAGKDKSRHGRKRERGWETEALAHFGGVA